MKKDRGRKYASIHFEQHSKKYQIGKRRDMVAYMDTSLQNSFQSMTDWLSKWIDALKKQTTGKTTLIQNDNKEGTASNNYKIITWWPMMWKIITAKMSGGDLQFVYAPRSVPWGTERELQVTRGTGELLHIDQHILNDCKMKWKN